MKKHLLFVLTWLLSFTSVEMYGTHIRGSQIEFENVGADSFLIRITSYRNCTGLAYKNNISIKISPANGQGCSTFNVTASMVSCKDITSLCATACRPCKTSSCNTQYTSSCNPPLTYMGIEKVVHEGLLIFPSNINSGCCNYRIGYNDISGARSSNITTGCAGQSLYIYADLNRCMIPQVSSPKFTDDPITIFHRGKCQSLNFSTFKALRSDSVSYHLVPALLMDSSTPVTYNSPNSYKYPLSGYVPPASQGGNVNKPWMQVKNQICSGFLLDSVTGQLTFKPSKIEQGPVCVKVNLWRYDSTAGKMIIVAISRRDIQIIIEDTNGNNLPQLNLPSEIKVCAGDTLLLDNIWVTDLDSIQTTNGKVQRDTVSMLYDYGLPGSTFTKTQVGASLKWSLSWPTTMQMISSTPYIFNITANDNFCPIPGYAVQNISVMVGPKPQVTRVIGIDTICYAAQLSALPDSSAPGYKNYIYQWTVPFPGGYIYNGATQTAPLPSGTSIVQLKVSSPNTCDLFLYDTLTTPNHFYIETIPEVTICKNSSYTIHIKTYNNRGSVTYYINNQSSGQSADSVHLNSVTADRIIFIKAIDSMGCNYTADISIHVTGPVITFGKTQDLCKGDTLVLHAGDNLGKGVAAYNWRNTTQPLVTLSNKEYMQVFDSGYWKVTVADSSGCFAEDSIQTFAHIIKPNAGADKQLCFGSSVTLTAKGAQQYDWMPMNMNSVIGGSSFNYKGQRDTTFRVYGYSYYNNKICDGWDTVNIYMAKLPVVHLGNDTSICKNTLNIKLDAKNPGMKYLWNTGSQQQSIQVLNAGTAWVKVTDSNNCSATDSINIYALPVPLVQLGNDTTICSNTAVHLVLNAPVQAGYTYLWQDSSTGSQWTADTPGIFRVRVTTGNGCWVEDSIHIIHEPIPIVYLGPDTTLCQYPKASVVLDAGIHAGVDYLWNTGNTKTTMTVKTSGLYSIKLTTMHGCVGGDSIQVNFLPIPTLSLGPDTSILPGKGVLLNGGDHMKSYHWNIGDTLQYIYVKDSGYYSVRVVNTFGCEASDTIHIRWIIQNGLELPSENAAFLIYPNPTSKHIYIYCSDKNQAAQYSELYNTEGKLVKKLSGQGGDVSDLANGTYLLHIHTTYQTFSRIIVIMQK